ncbi:MAG: hypothetical protein ACOC3Z_01200 [Nanoarchaeota archaeon]
MKIWITKNIRFGYKYTVNKNIRKQINSCLNEWLDDLITKKSKQDDVLIINGGLFTNTNPSLVAIDDAHNFLKKVSSKIKVYLVNTEHDIRIFDNKEYSTLDIFSDITNLVVIKDIYQLNNITIVPHNKTYSEGITLNASLNEFKDTLIPNIIQLEKDEDNPGVLVYDTDRNKHIIIPNNFSPKHITFKINNIEDFSLINENKKNFIHLEVNNKIVEENKLKINIELHKLNPHSVKYIDVKEEEKIETLNVEENFNIIDVIYKFIGEDEDVKKHFEKVLKIHNK